MAFLLIANVNNNTNLSDEDDFRLLKSLRKPELASWILRVKRDDPRVRRLELNNFGDRLGLGATAWGRLGRFLGRNNHLEELSIYGSVQDVPGLLAGLRDNRHIRSPSFIGVDIQDTEHLTLLVPFLSQNPSLRVVELSRCGLGQDSIKIISNSLLRRSLDTLRVLNLDGNNLGDIDLDELVQASSRSENLILLSLGKNGIGRKGCASLARLLENQDSSLKRLFLHENLIDDESAITLADSLAKNTKLEMLDLAGNNRMCKVGWLAMLKCVCNSAIIDDVVDSNHTLRSLGHFYSARWRRAHETSLNRALGINNANLLHALLNLNRSRNKMLVARRKIIRCHVLGSLNIGDSSIAASFMSRILAWITSGSDETGADLVNFRKPFLPVAKLDAVRFDAIFRILRSRPDVMVGEKKRAQKRKFSETNADQRDRCEWSREGRSRLIGDYLSKN